MRILVVLLATAAFCFADDDSGEVEHPAFRSFVDDDDSGEIVGISHVQVTPVIPQVKSVAHTIVHSPLPAHVPQVKTVPSTIVKSSAPAAAVIHGTSSSPAVTRLSKPGIRFNLPQTHPSPIPVEKAAVPTPASLPSPASVFMPKTTLKAVQVPASPAPLPVATFKAAEIPAQAPVTTFKTAGIPASVSPIVPSTLFQHNIQSLPLPYYTSTMTFGGALPTVQAAPVAAQPTYAFPQHAAPIPVAAQPVPAAAAIQVAEPQPITYTSSSEVAIPTASNIAIPTVGTVLRAKPLETQAPLTYWRDLITPNQLTNFIDLSTGGFSYVNVIGDDKLKIEIEVEDTPFVVNQPFRAIQSQYPMTFPVKASNPMPSISAASAQTSGVIAA